MKRVGVCFGLALMCTDPALGAAGDVVVCGDGSDPCTGDLDLSRIKDTGSGSITVGGNIDVGPTTASASIEVGANSSGDRHAIVDLIGDDTYTDYGLRLTRWSSGGSYLTHRGSAPLYLRTEDASADIIFRLNDTNRLTIEDDGDVAIGHASTTYKLDVNGTGRFADDVTLDDGLIVDTTTLVVSESNNRVGIGIADPDYKLHVVGSGYFNNDLQVGSANTLFVDVGVGVGIGTASIDSGHVLDVNGKAKFVDDIQMNEHVTINNGNSYSTPYSLTVGGEYSNPYYYALHADGIAVKPNGGEWGVASDRRLKTNIQPLDGALDMLERLQGVQFEWINTTQHDSETHAGFIAQDLEEVFPGWVIELPADGEDMALVPEGERAKGISLPNDFNAYLVEAIKELHGENQELRAQVDALTQLVCLEHPANAVCAYYR